MDNFLAERLQHVKPSATLAIASKAAQLKAQGQDIISLSTGEPDFDTPEHIKDAAIKALKEGFTKYTPVDGILELKQAVIDKLMRDNKLQYKLDEVLVSVGGKQSCYNICQAVLDKGDEAIILAPYWVSYPAMVKLAQATPVIVSAAADFKVTPAMLEKAISEKTKFIFLNSPSNPSGVAYSHSELKALGDVLLKYPKIIIGTDDMYEHILWNKDFVNIINACPKLKDRSVILSGVSKAYAMTGWRIGFAAGPAKIIHAMKTIQSQSTSNPCSIAQKAAVAALNGGLESVHNMVSEFQKRHGFLIKELNKIKGLKVIPADGTFYLLPDVSEIIKSKALHDDVEFCSKLLENTGLALVPGSAFGALGCVRLSFATDMNTLKEALLRLREFCK